MQANRQGKAGVEKSVEQISDRFYAQRPQRPRIRAWYQKECHKSVLKLLTLYSKYLKGFQRFSRVG
jgi:truncated hemoglobin YjbI